MGYKMREIESKLVLPEGTTYASAVELLKLAMGWSVATIRTGSSVDTYWKARTDLPSLFPRTVNGPLAQFLRVRERDGIRQITVKGKDKDSNLDRIEVDIDSTSDTHKIHRLFRCLLGKPAGVIAKTYTVWELESEYDTVCVYELTTPSIADVFVEVEARSMDRMLELEQQMLALFPGATRAPGSLYEMFIAEPVK